jgi:CRISPR-associated Csh1 family protein
LASKVILDFNAFIERKISKNKINIIVSLKIDGQTLKEHQILNQYLFQKYIFKALKSKITFDANGNIIWSNTEEDMICSVCSRIKQNITTEYKPYTFYSNDKRSYNTNSKFSTNSRMFPIDIQCAYLVEIGRCYVDKNFEFEFGGYNFKLIPKILFPNQLYQKKILDLKIDYDNLVKNEERITRIKQEEFLLSVLGDFNNTINYDMIFYEKIQSEFRILLHIKDIAPSKIKRIHEAFKASRKIGNDNRSFGNLISFYTIKRFFSIYEGNSIKYDIESFLEMINIIFTGEKVKKSHLLTKFFANLQNKIHKAKENPIKARQREIHATLLIFELLKQLDLLVW